jgi:hypothetical protein
MSISKDSPSSSLRERNSHTNVERLGLALGAARERTCRAASISGERQRRLEAAIDDWENEGGAAAEVPPASRPNLVRKLSMLQLSADLLRDDTFFRAVILSGLLLLIAGAGLAVLLND